MKKIVGIKGSPKENSNSSLLLTRALQGIKENTPHHQLEIEVINPSRLDIYPCQACFACYKDGKCIIDDEMQPLYSLFNKTDIFLVSTPVFFNGITAQLKTLIDRCQAIWSSKYRAENSVIDREKRRVGHLFVTGGAPVYEEQFVAAENVISMLFRVLNTEFYGMTKVSDVDEHPVADNENLLKKAYDSGIELFKTATKN